MKSFVIYSFSWFKNLITAAEFLCSAFLYLVTRIFTISSERKINVSFCFTRRRINCHLMNESSEIESFALFTIDEMLCNKFLRTKLHHRLTFELTFKLSCSNDTGGRHCDKINFTVIKSNQTSLARLSQLSSRSLSLKLFSVRLKIPLEVFFISSVRFFLASRVLITRRSDAD